MKIIGLTGGIASGKSTAIVYLKSKGIPTVDADKLAREALLPGSKCYARVCRLFPDAVTKDGKLDRVLLGEIIFNNLEAKRKLESIIHPFVKMGLVKAIFLAWLCGYPLLVLDIPLLFETHLDRYCSESVVIAVNPQIQKERLMKRNSWSSVQADARINSQMPMEEKCRRATIFIDNNDDNLEMLYSQLDTFIINRPFSFFYHRIILHALPLSMILLLIVHFLL